ADRAHPLKVTRGAPVAASHCGHSRSVHSNGTPFREPSSRGGSPMGVSSPPQFATRKMKKTTMCTVRRRLLLARSTGRIKRTEAPVVPRRFASTAPSPSIPVFTSGVPESDPCTWIPPLITNRAPMTTMNPTYSWSFSANTARPGSPSAIPRCHRTGSETATARIVLLWFGCHQRGATSGRSAIAASSATNGRALASGSWAPSMGPDTRSRRGAGQAAAVDAGLLPHPHRVCDDDGSGGAAAVVAGRRIRRGPRGRYCRRRDRRIVERCRVVHHDFSAQRLHPMEIRDPRPVRPRVGAVRGLELPVPHDVLPVARDPAVAGHVARQRRGRLELRGGEGVL